MVPAVVSPALARLARRLVGTVGVEAAMDVAAMVDRCCLLQRREVVSLALFVLLIFQSRHHCPPRH